MNKILPLWKKYWPFIIILLIETVLFIRNYIPGTNLVGWDNLYPELDFPLNIQRSFFAIWQEYRGLGVIDGMSHAANLAHYLFLFLLSFFLPQNLLRYVFIFLTHLLGGIGMYLLINYLIRKVVHLQNVRASLIPWLSLIGALFYQYNLATVQMFYLPFELFTVHFSAIPWTILTLLNYLESPSRKSFFFLFLTVILTTPQAHVPSIYLVMAFIITVILLYKLIVSKGKDIKVVLSALMLVILTNSFWGIPYIYSTIKQAKTIAQSKNNQMGTDDIFFRNQAFGDFNSTALLQGLTLDFVQYDYQKGKSDFMFEPWKIHLANPIVVVFSCIFFILAGWGLVYAFLLKIKSSYPFVILFIFSFLILGNDIPVLKLFSQFLHTYIPYFHNVFRFVFTKFSLLYSSMYSIFLVMGLLGILEMFKEFRSRKIGYGFVFPLFVLIFYTSSPSFNGNFFYSNLRVKIPDDYTSTFNFFRTQDSNSRIAVLPLPWYWAWTQNSWGTIGSGFTWFGIPQALLDRAFDPWSNYNENFYWELNQAVYGSNQQQLINVLKKYQVGWLMFDRSIISPPSYKALNIGEIDRLLEATLIIHHQRDFGKVSIYKVDELNDSNSYVSLQNKLPVVGPEYERNNYDRAFGDAGNYLVNTAGSNIKSDLYFPFRSLFSGRMQEELEFQVRQKDGYFSFTANIPKNLEGQKISIPHFNDLELVDMDEANLTATGSASPQMYIDGQYISDIDNRGDFESFVTQLKEGIMELRIPNVKGYFSYDSVDDLKLKEYQAKNCDDFRSGEFSLERFIINQTDVLKLSSINSSNCLDIELPNLSHKYGYLLTVESRNDTGKSLFFAVINKETKKTDLETYLPEDNSTGNDPLKSYFIIPPMKPFGLGYTLHFDNISIGRMETINELGRISINPIPYKLLTSLRIEKNNYSVNQTLSYPKENLEVVHPNPSLYQITIDPRKLTQINNLTLTLSQSYDKGWKAYYIKLKDQNSKFKSTLIQLFPFFFGQEINDHVMVNNWENGWNISDNIKQITNNKDPITIMIVYLPQYLEYIGFILMGVGILIILFYPKTMNVENNLNRQNL